jgi:hypothetical protein
MPKDKNLSFNRFGARIREGNGWIEMNKEKVAIFCKSNKKK